jgi:hypothetical protein
VITDFTNGRREVALALARDDEFENLTAHWGQNFSHGNSSEDEQMFVG